MLSLILCGSAMAGEPLVWTYSEAWWENATSDQANNCVTQDPEPGEDPFVICANARFRLTLRQTVELNPAANAHGVEQTVQIKDLSNNQIVSQETKSDFYTGTQTIFTAQTSHEIDATPDGTGMGPFEGLVQHFPQCPDTGHPGGGGTSGFYGFAMLYYRYNRVNYPGNPGTAWFTHRPHPGNDCPSICPSPVWALVVTLSGGPKPFASIVIPFAYGYCTYIGGGTGINTEHMCYDIIYID